MREGEPVMQCYEAVKGDLIIVLAIVMRPVRLLSDRRVSSG